MAKNILSTTIQQLDANGQSLSRRVTSVTDATPTVGDFRGLGLLTASGATSISLPITQVRQIQLRNTHASAKITVTWTPTTGASVVAGVLGPGDMIALWSQTTGSTYGISALSLNSDTANTTYEMFTGG